MNFISTTRTLRKTLSGLVPGLLLAAVSLSAVAQQRPGALVNKEDSIYVRQHYTKIERMVPMRDGVKLFTSIYLPKDSTKTYPIMFDRTPYSVAPYGEAYKTSLGPSMLFAKDGYIFVYQDVRGRYMSEGTFVGVRPHNPNKQKPTDIDESSDTYDTIDWLLKNVRSNKRQGWDMGDFSTGLLYDHDGH